MSRAPAPCSACARFADDRCTGYEKPRRADDTNEACPLWREAANRQERKAWAEQQKESA